MLPKKQYDKYGHLLEDKNERVKIKDEQHCAVFTNKDSLIAFKNDLRFDCTDCDYIDIDTMSIDKKAYNTSVIFCDHYNK